MYLICPFRPIVNLKFLNQFVEKHHFKMEDIRSLKDILQKGDKVAKLDIKDAYFSVPTAENYRKFLQFYWRNELHQFTEATLFSSLLSTGEGDSLSDVS